MSESLHDLYTKSVGSPCYKDFNSVVDEIYEKARERILDGCNLPYTINVSHYNQDLTLLNPTLASRYGIVGSFTRVGTDIVYSVSKFIKVGDDIPPPPHPPELRKLKRWW